MRAFVYVLIPLEREHCDKMARFEPFSSQERK